jgi:4a-hydroxytetrahydrobiopterin dehydratase
MPLDPSAITSALAELPAWSHEKIGNDDALVRRETFSNFATLMVAVNKIAEAAEAANHHPDLDIRYNRLTICLTSHDAGGVTQRDVKMAGQISSILG